MKIDLDFLSKLTKKEAVDQSELLINSNRFISLRLAQNRILQPTVEENSHVGVRVIVEKKTGFSLTNSSTRKQIKEAFLKAVSLARIAPAKEDFVSLPYPSSLPSYPPTQDEQLKKLSAQEAIGLVQPLLKKAGKKGFEVSGSITIESSDLTILNSNGLFQQAPFTQFEVQLIVKANGHSAFASQTGRFLDQLDLDKLSEKAFDEVAVKYEVQGLKPGKYSVILKPEAVAELITFLSFLGFSAQAFQEGRSFAKPDQEIASPTVTIWDDGLDSRGLVLPFDFEGVPKKKVKLVEKGVFKNLVYDTYTANREGKKSTGHALPYPNPYGPMPLNLFMKPGHQKIEELINSVEQGVLVSRFFYVNVEDPLKTIITGMTRDGTYLIKNGRLTKSLVNLRFTQSILQSLKQVEGASKERYLKKPKWAGCFVPALKIKNFNFTGVSGES